LPKTYSGCCQDSTRRGLDRRACGAALPARWRLRGRKCPEDVAQPGFGHLAGRLLGQEPFALPLQLFREPVAQARDLKRIDTDQTGKGLPRPRGLVIEKAANRKVGDLAFDPRLFPGFARRRSLGCQAGDQVPFGNDPARGIPAGDQKNLQVIALPPPAQCPALDADRTGVWDKLRRVFQSWRNDEVLGSKSRICIRIPLVQGPGAVGNPCCQD
jgi:hypothetical protein